MDWGYDAMRINFSEKEKAIAVWVMSGLLIILMLFSGSYAFRHLSAKSDANQLITNKEEEIAKAESENEIALAEQQKELDAKGYGDVQTKSQGFVRNLFIWADGQKESHHSGMQNTYGDDIFEKLTSQNRTTQPFETNTSSVTIDDGYYGRNNTYTVTATQALDNGKSVYWAITFKMENDDLEIVRSDYQDTEYMETGEGSE